MVGGGVGTGVVVSMATVVGGGVGTGVGVGLTGTGTGWAVSVAGSAVDTALVVDGTRFGVIASPDVGFKRALPAGCGAGSTAPS